MVDFSHAISLVGEVCRGRQVSAAIAGVTSIIECPDQIPAIGFVELLQLLTTVFDVVDGARSRHRSAIG